MSERRSDRFEGLGSVAVRLRRPILWASLVFFLVAGAVGSGTIDALSSGGFDAPDSDSVRAAEYLEDTFGAGDVSLMLLVTARNGDVDEPAVVAEAEAITTRLEASEHVTDVYSYWRLGRASPLRSAEGHQAVIAAHVTGNQGEVKARLDELSPTFRISNDVIDVQVTGYLEGFREAANLIEEDLRRAEMLVFPLTLIVLLIIFRSAVAAALPLVVGGIAIVGTLLILRTLAGFTEVSIFALNLAIAMGFGLGIDYSLFIVSRYREELGRGRSTEAAVVEAVATAGRTVAFSAVTVAAALLSLLIFPHAFLRSFGLGGIAVVSLAALAAIVTLPALLVVLGPRIDLWTVRRQQQRDAAPRWRRLTIAVMRRPLVIGGSAVVLLVLLGLPFARIELGLPDWRTLPSDSPTRLAVEEFEQNFVGGGNEGFPILVVVPGAGDVASRSVEIDAYASRLSLLDGAVRVDGPTGSYAQGGLVLQDEALTSRFARDGDVYFSIIPAQSAPPFSPRAVSLVDQVRAEPSPFPGAVVGGQTASFIDSRDAIFDRLPLALGVIVVVTLVVLFAAFGSMVVSLKAIMLNLLSLTATFGAMVWVFQDGNLSGFFDFTPRETIDIFNPILMFAVAFGLSMDYEVFLLSRIKEEYDRTGDSDAAVVAGVERTGRLITAAAVLLAVVFLAQVTSRVTIPKMFGLGMALAVLVDAFVVRTLLVPSFMKLAGRYNWWAPAALRRLRPAAAEVALDLEPPPERPMATAPARRARPLVAAGAPGRSRSPRPGGAAAEDHDGESRDGD